MRRSDAKKIAQTITNEQLFDMLSRAKSNIKDWCKQSKVNKSFSLGTAWNILAKDFDIDYNYHILAKINMIREFGEYLDDNLKPPKKKKKYDDLLLHHSEPDFKNW